MRPWYTEICIKPCFYKKYLIVIKKNVNTISGDIAVLHIKKDWMYVTPGEMHLQNNMGPEEKSSNQRALCITIT